MRVATRKWLVVLCVALPVAAACAGKTVFPDGEDSVWDGHGVITDTDDEHRSLLGRKIYETGPVLIGAEPPVSLSGSGMFVIY